MPEGDTIFRAARALDKVLAGHRITRFESVFPHLNRVHEDAPITGRSVTRVQARGKHLLLHVSDGLALRTHMRMSGSWHIYRTGEAWQRPAHQMRILLATADFQAVAFQVHDAEWLSERALARSAIAALGPDVLGSAFDAAKALARMRSWPEQPICDVLLDQHVLAGVGNVYKSELLFLAGVDPRTPVRALADSKLGELMQLAQRHLRDNVRDGAEGGIVTYRGLRRTTGRADPSARLWVYGRGGQPCRRCGTAILRVPMGRHARSTYFCPACQLTPPAEPEP
jgi:endonuclease VIII